MGNQGSFSKKMLERTYYRIWACLRDVGKRVHGAGSRGGRFALHLMLSEETLIL